MYPLWRRATSESSSERAVRFKADGVIKLFTVHFLNHQNSKSEEKALVRVPFSLCKMQGLRIGVQKGLTGIQIDGH